MVVSSRHATERSYRFTARPTGQNGVAHLTDAEAESFLKKALQPKAGRFDARDFRRALGQFATGVTVVTARTADGRRIGMTVNSFSSVSLNPPLVLWSLGRQSTHFANFRAAEHFAVNVLGAGQHHLSRQFTAALPDRFAGVESTEGPHGCPLLAGTIAHFVCRKVKEYEGGDHIILLAEVEEYKWFEGEPLVFHSGRYRVATRHPELDE